MLRMSSLIPFSNSSDSSKLGKESSSRGSNCSSVSFCKWKLDELRSVLTDLGEPEESASAVNQVTTVFSLKTLHRVVRNDFLNVLCMYQTVP